MHADHREVIPILHVKYRVQFLLGVRWGGMSYWVYVTLSCHNWKRIDFRYSDAYFIYWCCVSHKCVLVGYSRHKKENHIYRWYRTGITSLQSRFYIRYKYAIATQLYQFHTTDAWWFSLKVGIVRLGIIPVGSVRVGIFRVVIVLEPFWLHQTYNCRKIRKTTEL